MYSRISYAIVCHLIDGFVPVVSWCSATCVLIIGVVAFKIDSKCASARAKSVLMAGGSRSHVNISCLSKRYHLTHIIATAVAVGGV